jgi:putative salt-induced outer membrane protein YdiY
MKSLGMLFCTIAFAALTANAEQVTLKNGDKITGAVVKSDGKTLVFKTDYAGDLSISWASIQDLSSDKKLFVATPDKKLVSGTVTTQDADLVVTTPQGGVHVPKASAGLIRSEGEEAAYEASLHPSLTRNWEGGSNVGFSLARGNSKTENLNISFNADRPTLNDKITLYSTSLYSKSDKPITGQVIAKSIGGGGRYDRNILPKVFAFGSGDFLTDEVQGLDLRSIFTGGLGFHAIKTANTTLDLLGGANYTRETFLGVTKGYAGLTIGDDFSHKLGKVSLVTQRFNYYPNLTNGGGYHAAFDLGLVTKLNSWLGWQLGFTDHYTSYISIPGNVRNDVLATTGLALTFKH